MEILHYFPIWLPFAMIGAFELALKALPSDGRPLSRAAVIVGVMCLATLSVGGRDIGLVERVAGNPAAVRPLIHLGTPTMEARAIRARSALLVLKDKTSFVVYLGSSGWNVFTESGMRGWVVKAPEDRQFYETHIPHIPASVLRQLEWRQLSAAWLRQRVNRGMDAVLVQRGGPWDTLDLLQWAGTARLRDATEQPPEYILLLKT